MEYAVRVQYLSSLDVPCNPAARGPDPAAHPKPNAKDTPCTTLISASLSISRATMLSISALATTALMPTAPARAGPVLMQEVSASAQAELKALAEAQNPVVGYFDPLTLAQSDMWSQGNEASVGFLRHAEVR